MSILMQVVSFVAFMVILMRTIHQVAHLDHRAWSMQRARFCCFATSIALICGGAFGIALGMSAAPALLVLGVAGWFLCDRRGDRIG